VSSVKSQPTFRRNMSPPSSGYCLAYSSTLKMGAKCSSEKFVDSNKSVYFYYITSKDLEYFKFSIIYSVGV
jgi:hypothetical protein